jgi:hypothetical protein
MTEAFGIVIFIPPFRRRVAPSSVATWRVSFSHYYGSYPATNCPPRPVDRSLSNWQSPVSRVVLLGLRSTQQPELISVFRQLDLLQARSNAGMKLARWMHGGVELSWVFRIRQPTWSGRFLTGNSLITGDGSSRSSSERVGDRLAAGDRIGRSLEVAGPQLRLSENPFNRADDRLRGVRLPQMIQHHGA